jgi:ELWxxDGT repeat protein
MAFDFSDLSKGAELYVTKGKPSNTELVKNINPYSSSYPYSLTDVNGTLYFLADDGEHGMELWSSRGTSKTTHLVKDILPGVEWSNLFDFHNINGSLYFLENAGTPNSLLWSSDGTEAGTQPVQGNGLENLSAITTIERAGDQLFLGAFTYKYGSEMFVADILKKAPPLVSRAPDLPVKSSTSFDPVLLPNPADQVSSVRIPITVKNITIRVTDISGKLIWRKNAANTNAINLPVDTWPAGVYLVNFTSGKECRILKLVKN